MAHVILAVYASPEKHRMFIEKVNSMQYPFKGDMIGDTSPFISELKLYDVRMKKEIEPDFLRDINAIFTGVRTGKPGNEGTLEMKSNRSGHFSIMHKLVSLLRRFSPLKDAQRSAGKPNQAYQTPGWEYVMFIGKLDDPKTEEGEEIL